MAQTQLYAKRAQIFVSEEGTIDTYAVQAAGDVILGQDVTWTVESSNWTPQYARGDFLMGDEVPGSAAATLTFSVPCVGSGDPGDVPLEYTDALKMCGMYVKDTVATSTVASPTSTFDSATSYPHESYSATALIDGIRVGVKGGFGNLTFEGNPDGPGMFTFTMQGGYVAVADDALETPTYLTAIPPQFTVAVASSLELNIGGAYVHKGVESFSWDLGNTVVVGKDVNDTVGVYGARITGHNVTGTFSSEMKLVATQDPFGDWRAGTASTSFTTGVIGTAGTTGYTMALGRVVLRPPSLSDRNGIMAVEIPWAASSANTDVEDTALDLSITYA